MYIKRVVILILLTTSCTFLYSQTHDLYVQAIAKYIKKFNIKEDKKLAIQVDRYIGTDMVDVIEGVEILYITEEQMSSYTNKKNHGFSLKKVSPIYIDGEDLYISIVSFFVTRKGRKYLYGNQGGITFKVLYDCELGEYKLIEK